MVLHHYEEVEIFGKLEKHSGIQYESGGVGITLTSCGTQFSSDGFLCLLFEVCQHALHFVEHPKS